MKADVLGWKPLTGVELAAGVTILGLEVTRIGDFGNGGDSSILELAELQPLLLLVLLMLL